jgi:EamA domain-containing membrane protein RarD
MNKVIFQIGLLAFCVSFVMFSAQGEDMMQTAQRAFVVFAVVVSGIALLLFAASGLSVRRTVSGSSVAPGGSPGAHGTEGNHHGAA